MWRDQEELGEGGFLPELVVRAAMSSPRAARPSPSAGTAGVGKEVLIHLLPSLGGRCRGTRQLRNAQDSPVTTVSHIPSFISEGELPFSTWHRLFGSCFDNGDRCLPAFRYQLWEETLQFYVPFRTPQTLLYIPQVPRFRAA